MAVLIDEPRWWFRGRHWSHLVSDRDLDELHAFAEAAGIPRRGFHDDHYDVPEEYYAQLVAQAGVEVVLDQLDVLEQLGQPLEGVILTLDGDEHLTSGHEGVDREQAQARGAVDEDVVDPLTFHWQSFCNLKYTAPSQ